MRSEKAPKDGVSVLERCRYTMEGRRGVRMWVRTKEHKLVATSLNHPGNGRRCLNVWQAELEAKLMLRTSVLDMILGAQSSV